MKTTITEGALYQRLKRYLLRKENEVLKKGRPSYQLGDYYLVDQYRNVITNYGLTIEHLEDMARERGVIAELEELTEVAQ